MVYKFNMVKYVYGRLYAGTFEGNKTLVTAKKFHSWVNVLDWLQKNNYIYSYKVKVLTNKNREINYIFNKNQIMYERYLNAIKKSCDQSFIPGGEYTENNAQNLGQPEFEDQFSDPIERISYDDRVRRTLTTEEMQPLQK